MLSEPQITDDAVLISGGSGYIGSALVPALAGRGHTLVVLSRQPARQHRGAAVLSYAELDRLSGCRAIINLAGADIGGARWSAQRKRELRASRLETTLRLCQWARQLERPPAAFLSASAIGYYGDTGEDAAAEDYPPGQDFGARLCHDWEAEVDPPPGSRTAIFRFGVVLGLGGGALQRMRLPFRFGLGGPIGNGRQWMAWIAMDDLIRLLADALEQPAYQGVYNAVAPEPVRNRDFARSLGRVVQRPAVMPMPAPVLRALLGEMSVLLLNSQRIVPQRLREQGFSWQFPDLEEAMRRALEIG